MPPDFKELKCQDCFTVLLYYSPAGPDFTSQLGCICPLCSGQSFTPNVSEKILWALPGNLMVHDIENNGSKILFHLKKVI